MQITIKATGVELTPALNTYVQVKFGKLERFLKELAPSELIKIEIGEPSRHHRKGDVFYAEANLSLNKKLLRAEAYNKDLKSAINEVYEDLESQIKKLKDKVKEHHHESCI